MKNFFRYLFGKVFWSKYSDDLNYKGSWRNGRFNGKGCLKYKNGNVYNGYFKDGAKHGYGSLISKNGYEQQGNWLRGCQTGEGRAHYKNGDIYTGSFLNGVRNGFGQLFTVKDNRNYEGYWGGDNLVGDVRISSTSWTFKGKFTHSNLSASGKMVYKDQSTYEGSLSDFQRTGYGVYTNLSGEEIRGVWSKNDNVHNAEKRDIYGFVWQGKFKNLEPDGILKVILPDKKIYDGIWSKGKMVRALGVQGLEPKPYLIH